MLNLNGKYSIETFVHLSQCDRHSLMSVPAILDSFMDIATEHARVLGVGMEPMMAKSLFWITVKTRVKIFRRPKLSEPITVTTWPEPPGAVRCYRSYELKSGGELLACGRTEWAVLDMNTHRLHSQRGIYVDGTLFCDEQPPIDGFDKISEDFEGCPIKGVHTVRSTDIDLGGHMNNVAYARALFSVFSTAELEALNPTELQLIFRSSCYEGDELSFRIRSGEATELAAVRDNGEVVFLARMN